MGTERFAGNVSIGVDGFLRYEVFGQEVWITTTHIGMGLITATLLIIAVTVNRTVRRAAPDQSPSGFLNVIEMMVEAIDRLTLTNMGKQHGHRFSNYISTLFLFLMLSNMAGVFGLRSPTADYGVTLALGLITFFLIHYNGLKYQKARHVTNLFRPIFLAPIQIIGEIATPLSLSLRLFGNVLSGTVLLGLVYGLLPRVLLVIVPAFLHAYLDVFSGAVQTYVFCMLTMVFIAQTFDVKEETL